MKKEKEKPILKIGKVSRESVLKHTGKDWDQWTKILDRNGAPGWPHKEIVAFLKKEYKLSLWWQQGVATAYEVFIGRKIQGRNEKGEYATVATRTLPIGNKKLWNFLASERGLDVWLKPMSEMNLAVGQQYETVGGIFGQIRTMVAFRRIRMTWQDCDWDKHSVLQIYLVPRKGENRCWYFNMKN